MLATAIVASAITVTATVRPWSLRGRGIGADSSGGRTTPSAGEGSLRGAVGGDDPARTSVTRRRLLEGSHPAVTSIGGPTSRNSHHTTFESARASTPQQSLTTSTIAIPRPEDVLGRNGSTVGASVGARSP